MQRLPRKVPLPAETAAAFGIGITALLVTLFAGLLLPGPAVMKAAFPGKSGKGNQRALPPAKRIAFPALKRN